MQLRNRVSREDKFYAKKQALFCTEITKNKFTKRKSLASSLHLLKNAIQAYILRNLLKKTQPPPPLVMDVETKIVNFLIQNFNLTKKYKICDDVLSFLI